MSLQKLRPYETAYYGENEHIAKSMCDTYRKIQSDVDKQDHSTDGQDRARYNLLKGLEKLKRGARGATR